ncbi:hypothetical protein K474DRAFT_177452 [Panus rudis PR-1116 ss-1]|nr:hypothetical protein K474DRAFT_177452 [Panus rudis PR-1116 ss-1]
MAGERSEPTYHGGMRWGIVRRSLSKCRKKVLGLVTLFGLQAVAMPVTKIENLVFATNTYWNQPSPRANLLLCKVFKKNAVHAKREAYIAYPRRGEGGGRGSRSRLPTAPYINNQEKAQVPPSLSHPIIITL